MKEIASSLSATQEQVLFVIKQCAQVGSLRHIDWACSKTFAQLSPKTSTAPILLAVCLLSHMEGMGHTSLPLKALLGWRNILGPEPQLWHSIERLMPQNELEWQAALNSSALIRQDAEGWEQSNAELFDPSPVVYECWSEEPSLYFRRHWISEFLVAKSLMDRCSEVAPHVPERLKHLLSLLFPEQSDVLDWQQLACALSIRSGLTFVTGGPGTGKTYTVARMLALIIALEKNRTPFKIALAAPTGKAATRLIRSIQNAMGPILTQLDGHVDISQEVSKLSHAHTLHSLLGASADGSRFKFNAKNPLNVNVLIVDEASMVNLEMMSALMQALDAKVKLIFLGDPDQLAAVEAGSVLANLCQKVSSSVELNALSAYSSQLLSELGCVMPIPVNAMDERIDATSEFLELSDHIVNLKRSHRFEGPIASLAELIKSAEPPKVTQWLKENARADSVLELRTLNDVRAVVEQSLKNSKNSEQSNRPNFYPYLQRLNDLIQEAKKSDDVNPFLNSNEWIKELLFEFERFRVLCAANEGPMGSKNVNLEIEKEVLRNFELPKTGEWYAGRPIMVTRNQHDLGLSNGDVGLVLPEQLGQSTLKAYFLSGDQLRIFSLSRLVSVQTAFAMSIHKSQGSEYEHTLMILPDRMEQALSKEMLYTGVTRAKKYLTLVQEDEGLIAKAMSQVADRSSGLSAQIKRLKKHLIKTHSPAPTAPVL